MKIKDLASIVHEANAAYCRSVGDFSQPTWANAPRNIQSSAVDNVMFISKNPELPPSASHENWLAFKEADGWVHGYTKDADNKTHPCMVPYEELPDSQKIKDALFHAIVHVFLDELEYDEHPDGALAAVV